MSNSERRTSLYVASDETLQSGGDRKLLSATSRGEMHHTGNVDCVRVSNGAKVFVFGDVNKVYANHGTSWVQGDVDFVRVSDYGQVWVFGDLRKVIVKKGYVFVTGDIDIIEKSDCDSIIKANYKIPEEKISFIKENFPFLDLGQTTTV